MFKRASHPFSCHHPGNSCPREVSIIITPIMQKRTVPGELMAALRFGLGPWCNSGSQLLGYICPLYFSAGTLGNLPTSLSQSSPLGVPSCKTASCELEARVTPQDPRGGGVGQHHLGETLPPTSAKGQVFFVHVFRGMRLVPAL